MGCVQSKEDDSSLMKDNNEENIVCQICDVCFNTKERAPLVICPSNHSSCKECIDSFGKKGIDKCPFCRVAINFAGLEQNMSLLGKLARYENEEKSFAKKNPAIMSMEERIKYTSEEARKHNYMGVY